MGREENRKHHGEESKNKDGGRIFPYGVLQHICLPNYSIRPCQHIRWNRETNLLGGFLAI
jgi:hypothetical protein